MKRFFIFFLLISGMAFAAPADRDALFATATEALEAGNYQEAFDGYQELLKQGEAAAALYFNMGLTLKGMNRPVDAAVYFRRALVLDPGMIAARRELEEMPGGIPPTPFSWKEEFSSIVPPRIGLIAGSVIFWIGLLLLQTKLSKTGRLGMPGVMAIVLLVLGAALTIASYLADPFASDRRAALITSEQAVALRRNPADNSPSIASFPPGTNLQLVDESAGWVYAKAPDNVAGWLPEENVTRIIPAASTNSGAGD